jgi:uncharacterized protein YciI
MRYIALFDHGPNWDHDKNLYEQGQPMTDHLHSMQHRFDEGSLLLGGPFDDTGGIAVLDVADAASATALLNNDPAVASGHLTYKLHLLLAYFDALTEPEQTSPSQNSTLNDCTQRLTKSADLNRSREPNARNDPTPPTPGRTPQ